MTATTARIGRLPDDAETSTRAMLELPDTGRTVRSVTRHATVPVLARRDTRPLTDAELDALRRLVEAAGYGGVLLRLSDTWAGARNAAYTVQRTKWFSSAYGDSVVAVPRRIEPAEGIHGVFLVARRALINKAPDTADGDR